MGQLMAISYQVGDIFPDCQGESHCEKEYLFDEISKRP